MFSKLMSISDRDMWVYYDILSDRPDKIDLQNKVLAGSYHPKQAKQELAKEITQRFYGEEKARSAWEYFENRHKMNQSVDYPEKQIGIGARTIANFLVEIGVAKTKSDAKRLLDQGAVEWVRLDGTSVKMKDFGYMVVVDKPELIGILRVGKVFLKIIGTTGMPS
jgi:tyrosyl-tRNA synthetase